MSYTLKEKAYDTIRNKILKCEYAPNSYLNEKQLCEELNVSRTPIRDALSRLEQERLVTILPKRGVLVSPVTTNEINMIYETRILLEPYVITTYGHKINGEKQDRLEEILLNSENNKNDIQALFDLDDEFHHLLLNLCENKYFLQTYAKIHAQNSRLRIISGNYVDKRLKDSHTEHLTILDYIIKKDYKKAAKAMETHLLNSKESAFKAILSSNISL